jgi:hypothetical protein
MPASLLRWCVLLCYCWETIFAQGVRSEWKQHGLDLEDELRYSLANAPLADRERTQIFQSIEKTYHGWFGNQEEQRERETILTARLGHIVLATNGSKQLLVRSPLTFCGATGNCALWVFARQNGVLRLVLDAEGGPFIVSRKSNQGFHDIAIGFHDSAFEESIIAYRWNGTAYAESDCYLVRFDRDEHSKPPQIVDCPSH